MTKIQAKPVTILTGFLGAGKTTFLNALITYKKGIKLAVIENEFGMESTDGQLVIGADENLFELSNGCICCSLNEEFYDILKTIWTKKDEFDELVIETTGIADPASVANPFLTTPSLLNCYQLKRVICLVDARLVENQLKETEEARKQISFSDVLLITKTDLVEEGHLLHIKKILKKINPLSIALFGNKENYPIKEAFEAEPNKIIQLKIPKLPARFGIKHDHHQHDDVVSLCFYFSEPFDLEALFHRLNVFLTFQAKDIYRVKGIINAHGQEEKIVLQSVSNDLALTAGNLWMPDEERTSRIVFIGKKLKPDGFENMLKQCLFNSSLVKDYSI